MKKVPVQAVSHAVLQWARESIGLSVAEVAGRLKRTSGEIEAWERGDSAPTYVQLEKLAYQLYKRPLAVFFLPAPPDEKPATREFRTLPDADMRSLAADTHYQIRRAHAYQLALEEIFTGKSPYDQPIWRSIELLPASDLAAQATRVRAALGITLESQSVWGNTDTALKQWRAAIEAAGIFVFKAAFEQKEISGLCLRHAEFPLIHLNNSTTKTRQVFSLLHELAHLLLKVNGLSKFDSNYIEGLATREQQIERFCNAFAAETLIPAADFRDKTSSWPRNVEQQGEQHFSTLAARYGVSREAILRRFLDQGRISANFYKSKARDWESQRTGKSGGNYYATQNVYLSERFAREVFAQHFRRALSADQAAELLGVKAKSLPGLEALTLHGATA